MGVGVAGTLTRSRIEAFDQTANQLSQCASQWRAAASDLDSAADSYVSQIANPGGTQWHGQASAAALDAAHMDRVSVTGAVMHAHAMADVAEPGSSSLRGARAGALEAISTAEADDFTVGEDLSVADNLRRRGKRTGGAVNRRFSWSTITAEAVRIRRLSTTRMPTRLPRDWRKSG